MSDWLRSYLQQQSPAELHFQIIVLLGLMVFVLHRAYRHHQHRRFIEDTPTSHIASAAQGFVELQGWGEYMPEASTRSPFSSRQCLWYHCRIEQRRRSGKRSHWVEYSDERSDDLFQIQDESGECVVIPEGAQVTPALKEIWYGSGLQARHQVTRQGGWLSGLIGFGRYRFTEELILVADPLYIMGYLESVQKSIHPHTVEQQVRELLKTWKLQPERYLRSFDHNQDNRIDRDEWQQVKAAARQQVLQQHQMPLIHTIRKPDEKHHPFLVSCQNQQELSKKNQIYGVIYVLLFFILLYLFLILLDFTLTR